MPTSATPDGVYPVYAAPSAGFADRVRDGARDLAAGFSRRALWTTLAREELRKRYHGTFFGFFWSFLSFALFVSVFIFVFGVIRDADLSRYGPHVATGWMVWGLISSLVTGGCQAFVRAAAWIGGTALPYSIFIYRDVWTQLLLLVSSVAVALGVVIGFRGALEPVALLAIPGLALTAAFGFGASLFFGTVCLRLRDARFLVEVMMRAAFFLTPILWTYRGAEDSPRAFLASFNPFTHFVEVVRLPLIGVAPSALNWVVAGGVTVLSLICGFLVFAVLRRRIPLWV